VLAADIAKERKTMSMTIFFQRRVAHCLFNSTSRSQQFSSAIVDPELTKAHDAPTGWDPASAVVYPEVITEQQAAFLEEYLTAKFKR
jgi:hypothetical protein